MYITYLLNIVVQGATTEELTTLPERAQQIFVMSQNISDTLKEDLAWASYVLLRNTKSVSVVISELNSEGKSNGISQLNLCSLLLSPSLSPFLNQEKESVILTLDNVLFYLIFSLYLCKM